MLVCLLLCLASAVLAQKGFDQQGWVTKHTFYSAAEARQYSVNIFYPPGFSKHCFSLALSGSACHGRPAGR
jgi:hypothetical protein